MRLFPSALALSTLLTCCPGSQECKRASHIKRLRRTQPKLTSPSRPQSNRASAPPASSPQDHLQPPHPVLLAFPPGRRTVLENHLVPAPANRRRPSFASSFGPRVPSSPARMDLQPMSLFFHWIPVGECRGGRKWGAAAHVPVQRRFCELADKRVRITLPGATDRVRLVYDASCCYSLDAVAESQFRLNVYTAAGCCSPTLCEQAVYDQAPRGDRPPLRRNSSTVSTSRGAWRATCEPLVGPLGVRARNAPSDSSSIS